MLGGRKHSGEGLPGATVAAAVALGREYLKVDPPEPKFVAGTKPDQPHMSHHKVRNMGKEKVAIKIKCSDNKSYRLRPVFSIVDPGKEVALIIARMHEVKQPGKIILQLLLVKEDQPPEPHMAWKNHKGPPDGSFTLSLGPTLGPSLAASSVCSTPGESANNSVAGQLSAATAGLQ